MYVLLFLTFDVLKCILFKRRKKKRGKDEMNA